MPEYFLLVRATDRGTPSLNSTVNVHIIITVANNAPPKFEQNDYIVELHENEKPGKPLTAIIATSRSSVYYEIITGNINDSFTINPTSGVLRTNAMLDFEAKKFYNLTVRATNMVGANSTTSVLVHVIDRNDNAPIFYQLEYKGQVVESDKIRSMVLVDGVKPLVVSAFDKDSEINSVLHYKIVEKSASAYFSIDPNTGMFVSKIFIYLLFLLCYLTIEIQCKSIKKNILYWQLHIFKLFMYSICISYTVPFKVAFT